MDFARQQRNPMRHSVGLTIVVLLHVIVIYALLSGLARRAVEVIKKPLSATIIEEVKLPPPPPPPPKKIIEPPKAQPQVQPYVPPPDIPVPTAPTESVISAPTTVVPTEPVVIAPPTVAPAPKPAIRKGLVPITRVNPIYPKDAIRAGIAKGHVIARLSVDEQGNVTEVRIIEAEPPGVFNKEVTRAMMLWKFRPEGEKFIGDVELNFTLKDE